MITIDAQNKILGRLASEIAIILMGKNKPDYISSKITGSDVSVIHADKIRITGRKMEAKLYYHHTLYPGHLHSKRMKDFSKQELIKKAVYNMLPKNKLRRKRIMM